MAKVIIAGAGNRREMPLRSLLEAGHVVGVVEDALNIDASTAHFWVKESLTDSLNSGSFRDLLQHQWDCFTVWGEYAVSELERVRSMTNLPGPELVPELVRDKAQMRRRVSRTDVLQPAQAVCSSVDEAETFRSSIGPKSVVVKPRDGAGSAQVRYVDPSDDLAAIIEEARLLEASTFLCEEFVAGKEYSCELLMLNGSPHIYGVTEKFQTAQPWFYEIAEMFPAALSRDLQSSVRDLAESVSSALEVRNASMHIEFKVGIDGLYLIEAAGRLAGDDIPLLVAMTTGVNPYLAEIEWYAHRQVPPPVQGGSQTALRAFVFGVDVFRSRPLTPTIETFLNELHAQDVMIRRFEVSDIVENNEPRRTAVATGMTRVSSEQMRRQVNRVTEGIF